MLWHAEPNIAHIPRGILGILEWDLNPRNPGWNAGMRDHMITLSTLLDEKFQVPRRIFN